MADFKVIDETLFQYVKEETRKRFPDIEFTSSSLGRGRLAVEDRYFNCYLFAHQQKPYLYFHQGYVYLITDNECNIPDSMELKEKTADFVKYRSKQRIINTNSYQLDDADVLDMFLALIRKMRGVNPPTTESLQQYEDTPAENEEVSLSTMSLQDLFQMPLCIPDYQRIYCWEEKNVTKLLDDIFNIRHSNPYHLGNVILQFKDNRFHIIDGQQRLVTLALILSELGSNDILLLNERFESREARSYVAYNKFIIRNYIEKFIEDKDRAQIIKSLLDRLIFSVLILNDQSLELSYTFFSNQNSRGKSLTDYELLKSHHLRFISSEEQAKHLAMKWDNMLLNYENDEGDRNVSRTMETYLFRLRKWLRKNTWYDDERYKVKTEFEAAPIIAEIPPFGERFFFDESIQGGSHFFAYVDHFIFKYEAFKNTNSHIATIALDGETHSWYRDVIQAFLFAYYLKFGTLYLEEALVCISEIVSRHRYGNGRANFQKLMQYSGDCELIMMLDRATSPTFFLAECLARIKSFTKIPSSEINGIRERFFNKEKSMIEQVKAQIKNDGIDEIVKIVEYEYA